jgi:hypothetical protein
MLPAAAHGTWTGPNRLWMIPGTPTARSEGRLDVHADRVVIRWSHEGVEHIGELRLSGPPTACRCDFRDSFHAPSGLVLHGEARRHELALFTTYPAGPGQPDWGWRITLDWSDPEHVTLRMFNVLPDGFEALAVDLRGGR